MIGIGNLRMGKKGGEVHRMWVEGNEHMTDTEQTPKGPSKQYWRFLPLR